MYAYIIFSFLAGQRDFYFPLIEHDMFSIFSGLKIFKVKNPAFLSERFYNFIFLIGIFYSIPIRLSPREDTM